VLGEHLMPYNLHANEAYVANHINVNTPAGLASLNDMLTNQAVMIAYIDDYKLMMIMTLCVIPLLLLLRVPKKSKPTDTPVVME
jgi:MFS transporter, DHA2 family, multidrug resistance protein